MNLTPEQTFAQQNPGVDINSPQGRAQFQQWSAMQGGSAPQTPQVSTPPQPPPEGTNPFSPTGVNTPTTPTAPVPPSPLQSAGDAALLSGATRAASGGNTYQVQGGNQQGQFGTQGQETTTGMQQQQQYGSAIGSTAGTQKTTGTNDNVGTTASAHNVADTLGFGSLLQGGVDSAKAADASRGSFLSDLVNTGGSGFNQQVDAAVRGSLSGPGMQGVGDSAKGRAAGYATEAVARDNANQRLNAAGQLAGPTAQQTLATAGNPFLGSNDTAVQASKGSNTSIGTSTGTTSQNTSNIGSLFSDTLSSQAQKGTSSAQNMQVAAGNQPEQGTTKSGGGSVVCSALVEREMLDRELVLAEAHFVKQNWPLFEQAARGYYLFGVPLAKLVRRYKLVALMCLPIARACSVEAARRSGWSLKKRWYNAFTYRAFFILCDTIGTFVSKPATINDREVCRMLNDTGLHLDLL